MFSLGQRIRELRLKKGLTQTELAKGIVTASMLSQVESNRAKPSYKILSAIANKLEVSLDKLLADVNLNLEYIGHYKMAKAMVADGSYRSAIPLLIQILDEKRAVISEDELYIELAECYMYTQQFEKSEQLLAKVQESAVLRRDTLMIIRTYRIMGKLEFIYKRYQLSAHHWKKALDEIERMEHQDTLLKAEVLTDLGRATQQIGDVKEAICYYSQASTLYESASSMEEIAKVYMGLGQSYMQLMDFEKAAEYSQQATSIFQALNNVYMSVKVQMLTAVSNIQEGLEQDAIRILEESIRKLQELRKNEDVGIAYVELAKVHLGLNELEKAEECCQIARSLLPELHPYQARGNRILGSISHERGNDDEACRRFKMAADCFKTAGEISEWAKTMEEISRVKEERNELPEAISIISEVHSYIQTVLNERGIVL